MEVEKNGENMESDLITKEIEYYIKISKFKNALNISSKSSASKTA